MLSICIPSTSVKKIKRNLLYIKNQLLESSIIKEIEICIHINGHETTYDEIFKNLKNNFKKQFSNSIAKTTFQESYTSVIKLATQKFLIVIGDTDEIKFKSIEKFLQVLKDYKKNKLTYIFDNTQTSYTLSSEFINQKLIDLNIKRFEKFFMPYTPTYIGNVIFDSYYIKRILIKYSKIKTEFPHVLPYLFSLTIPSSSFYTDPIVKQDMGYREWSFLQNRFNSFDLIRIYSIFLKNLSINNLSLCSFEMPLNSLYSLPKTIIGEIIIHLYKKKSLYPNITQPILEVLTAYINCTLLFLFFIFYRINKIIINFYYFLLNR